MKTIGVNLCITAGRKRHSGSEKPSSGVRSAGKGTDKRYTEEVKKREWEINSES